MNISIPYSHRYPHKKINSKEPLVFIGICLLRDQSEELARRGHVDVLVAMTLVAMQCCSWLCGPAPSEVSSDSSSPPRSRAHLLEVSSGFYSLHIIR